MTKKLHINTKLVSCRKNHTCEYCSKQIKVGEKAYRTNTQFIKPFYRCLAHCPTKQEITDMIQEEMEEYHCNDIGELEKKLADGITWQKACELACAFLSNITQDNVCDYEDYFYQQAKKESKC